MADNYPVPFSVSSFAMVDHENCSRVETET